MSQRLWLETIFRGSEFEVGVSLLPIYQGLSQMEGKNLIRTDYSNKKELDKNTTISTKVTRIEEAPPRPPSPDMKDVMAVPPPRPPAPSQYIIMDSDDVSLPATLPRPPSPSAPLPTQSIIYRSLNQGESPQSTLRVREGVVLTANTNNACGSSSESANNRYCYNVYNVSRGRCRPTLTNSKHRLKTPFRIPHSLPPPLNGIVCPSGSVYTSFLILVSCHFRMCNSFNSLDIQAWFLNLYKV